MKRIALAVVFALAACSAPAPTSPPEREAEAVSNQPQLRERMRMQTVMSLVDRVLMGWDRGAPRVVELLGKEPRPDLVPGRDILSKSFPVRVRGGWEIDALGVLASRAVPLPHAETAGDGRGP